METEYHFHIAIYAPQGLHGIEPFLENCELRLDPWVSGFNGQVILRLQENTKHLDFQMDPSTTETMYASGYFYIAPDEAWKQLLSLSGALQKAGFPHWIGLDDDQSQCFRQINFRCYREGQIVWLNA